MNDGRRSILGLVFLTVFLDIVGFSVLFPLFPRMLEYYVALEGDESAVGELVRTLGSWTDGDPFAVVVLFGGLLGSLYSILQFLFAPVWGGLSDRVGRRPVLCGTLAGMALSYLGWMFADGFIWLIVARLLGGAMAGNISTASAAVADSTAPSERAKGMGIVGMAIGLGFVLGPAVGALAMQWDLSGGTVDGGPGLGFHPFSGAAVASFGLTLLNLVMVWRKFPETRVAVAGAPSEPRGVFALSGLRRLNAPGIVPLDLAYLLFLTAFSAMEFTLTFLAVHRFDHTVMQNAAMFVYVGLLIALVQGGVVRRYAPRVGERKLASAGVLLTAPGLAIVGACDGRGWLYIGLGFMAVGSALVTPCLGALVSRYTSETQQGLSQGVFRSMGSLSRAVGPILGGVLYWQFGSATPYYAAAAALLLPLVLVSRLPAPPEGA